MRHKLDAARVDMEARDLPLGSGERNRLDGVDTELLLEQDRDSPGKQVDNDDIELAIALKSAATSAWGPCPASCQSGSMFWLAQVLSLRSSLFSFAGLYGAQ